MKPSSINNHVVGVTDSKIDRLFYDLNNLLKDKEVKNG